MNRVGKEVVRIKVGIERELAVKVNQRVLRWFRLVVRMDEYRMTKGGFDDLLSGSRVWGQAKVGLDG